MSILNGNINDSLVHTEEMPFGAPIVEVSCIPKCAMTVAALNDDIIICGGWDYISLYRMDENGQSKEVSQLEGLGNVRQIGVWNNFAYVSAREDGVFICDLANPEKPLIAYHIDSVELATGIAVADGVLAITNRHMGCELYDVREPYNPCRMGHFICGEAQSVWLHNNMAIIGDWMNHQVLIFDISQPDDVKKLSCFQVDGFADGVCVVKKGERLICMSATGHHSGRLKNRLKYHKYTYVTAEMIAEGYGCGHGVEFYDITNPAMPEWLATLKTPPLFGGPDTWQVYSDGNNCVFTDSMNGIFTISLEDILQPVFTGHYRLEPLAQQIMFPPSVQVQTGCITGAASVKGFICGASVNDGVHILRTNKPLGNFIRPAAKVNFVKKTVKKDRFYCSDGQIHGFVQVGEKIYCASGKNGIEILDLKGKLTERVQTQGICHDLCLHNGMLYAAEGGEGICCYKIGEELTEHIRTNVDGCVRQIVEAGESLVAQVGCGRIVRINTQNSELTAEKQECTAYMLYHRHLSKSPAGKYVVAMPLSQGALLVATENGTEKVASNGLSSCPFAEGACGCGEKLIVIHHGHYICLDNPLDIVKPYTGITVKGAELSGIPYVMGEKLVILNRYTGTAEILDISDIHNPVFIQRVQTGGYPEACGLIDDEIYLAMGFDGIVKL